MAGYMGFRFLVEFLKPTWKPYLGLSAIQVVSLVVFFVAVFGLRQRKGVCESPLAHGVGDGGL
jgi:hypothetical protein